jgi:BirA family transcriptional regulator, biotin operon repressor / biotin---[acetyl-CoA-carboxylase] ligase
VSTADLSRPELRRALGGDLDRQLRVSSSTGSTNSDALAWADRGAAHGAVVVTDHQTAGRGRRGRSWLSQPGRALQFSVVLRPEVPAADAGLLSTMVGVAAAEGIASCSGLAVRLQWPNDVTVEGRKLAGILVETRVADSLVRIAVAGVGINVDWRCSELPGAISERATSLRCELERAGRAGVPARAELLAAVVARLDALYPMAVHPAGVSEIVGRATALSDVVGRTVVVRLAHGEVVEGVATRVAASGALELSSGGRLLTVEAGEVERVRRS